MFLNLANIHIFCVIFVERVVHAALKSNGHKQLTEYDHQRKRFVSQDEG